MNWFNYLKNLIDKRSDKIMNKIIINVKGMVCGGCEKRVINALSEISPITRVEADHQEGKVTIWTEGEVNLDKVRERIIDLGFEVEEG